MRLSRRTFITSGAAAFVAARTSAQASLPARALNPKKGLAGIAPENSGLTTSWYYDWSLRPAQKGLPLADPKINFYPMCWSWYPRAAAAAAQSSSAETAHAANSSIAMLEGFRGHPPAVLFGFNEPDKKDQSNMSVDVAIDAWPMFQGISNELVSPSCAKPEGPWMAEFMAGIAQRKLKVDALGFHHYGSADPDDFIQHLEHFHSMYNRPVWVTEFAVADWQAKSGQVPNRYSVEQVTAFMKATCAYMDKTPWVRGYAWFPRGGQFGVKAHLNGPLATSVLFEQDGTLNGLGKTYAAI